MNINVHGREVYSVEVVLAPAATGTWEASFDGGTTWVAGTDLGNGSFGWLVAGALNEDTDNAAVFRMPDPATGVLRVNPQLRLVTGEEEIVVSGPVITY